MNVTVTSYAHFMGVTVALGQWKAFGPGDGQLTWARTEATLAQRAMQRLFPQYVFTTEESEY